MGLRLAIRTGPVVPNNYSRKVWRNHDPHNMDCFYNVIRSYKERVEFSDGEFDLRGMTKFNKQQRFVHKQPGADGLRVRRLK